MGILCCIICSESTNRTLLLQQMKVRQLLTASALLLMLGMGSVLNAQIVTHYPPLYGQDIGVGGQGPIRTFQDTSGSTWVLVWESSGMPCRVAILEAFAPLPEGSAWKQAPEGWDRNNPTPIDPSPEHTQLMKEFEAMKEGTLYQVKRQRDPIPESEMSRGERKLQRKWERAMKVGERRFKKLTKKRLKEAKKSTK